MLLGGDDGAAQQAEGSAPGLVQKGLVGDRLGQGVASGDEIPEDGEIVGGVWCLGGGQGKSQRRVFGQGCLRSRNHDRTDRRREGASGLVGESAYRIHHRRKDIGALACELGGRRAALLHHPELKRDAGAPFLQEPLPDAVVVDQVQGDRLKSAKHILAAAAGAQAHSDAGVGIRLAIVRRDRGERDASGGRAIHADRSHLGISAVEGVDLVKQGSRERPAEQHRDSGIVRSLFQGIEIALENGGERNSILGDPEERPALGLGKRGRRPPSLASCGSHDTWNSYPRGWTERGGIFDRVIGGDSRFGIPEVHLDLEIGVALERLGFELRRGFTQRKKDQQESGPDYGAFLDSGWGICFHRNSGGASQTAGVMETAGDQLVGRRSLEGSWSDLGREKKGLLKVETTPGAIAGMRVTGSSRKSDGGETLRRTIEFIIHHS